VLGSELAPRLVKAGYAVRVMSRLPRLMGRFADVEWAQADLETGAGIAEAVEDIDIIVNSASSAGANTHQVDVVGARQMLERARAAGVSHVVHVSIVGIDRLASNPYYQQKLEAEQVIAQSGLPWTTLRITQFHSFIESRYLIPDVRPPQAVLPTDFLFQSIDVGEAAECLAVVTALRPAGQLLQVGGPEVLRLGDMARVWMEARGMQHPIVDRPLTDALAEGRRAGYGNCPANRYGSTTWTDWVRRKYGG